MGSVSSSASLLGFEEEKLVKAAEAKRKAEEKKGGNSSEAIHPDFIDYNPLSTIAEERSSQLLSQSTSVYGTPDSDPSVSLSIEGREVSVSLYETPDLTEADAKEIVEMWAQECSEHLSGKF